MMTPEKAVFASILVCIAGAVLTWLTARWRTLAGWLAFLVTAATAALVFFAVATVLAGGASARSETFCDLPAIGFALRLHVDGLTALFLLLAALIARARFLLFHRLYAALPGLWRRTLLSLGSSSSWPRCTACSAPRT